MTQETHQIAALSKEHSKARKAMLEQEFLMQMQETMAVCRNIPSIPHQLQKEPVTAMPGHQPAKGADPVVQVLKVQEATEVRHRVLVPAGHQVLLQPVDLRLHPDPLREVLHLHQDHQE